MRVHPNEGLGGMFASGAFDDFALAAVSILQLLVSFLQRLVTGRGKQMIRSGWCSIR